MWSLIVALQVLAVVVALLLLIGAAYVLAGLVAEVRR